MNSSIYFIERDPSVKFELLEWLDWEGYNVKRIHAGDIRLEETFMTFVHSLPANSILMIGHIELIWCYGVDWIKRLMSERSDIRFIFMQSYDIQPGLENYFPNIDECQVASLKSRCILISDIAMVEKIFNHIKK